MVEDLEILLSDRDKVFLELSKTYLKKTGANVLTSQNGKETYDIIRDKRPHLVIMSAEMPSLNGFDCCLEVKLDKSLRTIPVILTLTSGNSENLERCRRAGCDDVILKPINRDTFISVIKKHVTLNRRAAPRFPADIPVIITLDDGSILSGNTVDISTEGMFVQTDEKITAGSSICICFTFPASNVEIKCNARVAWINQKEFSIKPAFPKGIGTEFIQLNEMNRAYLAEYIKNAHVEPILLRI